MANHLNDHIMEIRETQSKNVERRTHIVELQQSKEIMLKARAKLMEDGYMDEDTKEVLLRNLIRGLEENSRNAESFAGDLQHDVNRMRDISSDAGRMLDDIDKHKTSLSKKRQILQKVGLAYILDNSINDLSHGEDKANTVQAQSERTMRELEEMQRKANQV